jgi:predicted TIM-barrel fold metal-dependent hydrolase
MQEPSLNAIIDTHFHVFEAQTAVAQARYVPPYAALLTQWLAAAHTVGVSHGVVVQPSFLGTHNSQLLKALQAQPDALRGVAVISPQASLPQLQDLHAAGVRGLRLNLAGTAHDMREWAAASPLWDAVLSLAWHVELHTDAGGLPAVIRALPDSLPLVIDHMTKPERAALADATVSALIKRARKSERSAAVHVKLSGAYRLGAVKPEHLAPIWLHELGASALLWGSDWPCTKHEHLADYAALFQALPQWLGDEHLSAVLGQNPWRLYWADTAAELASGQRGLTSKA